ncbi:MAG: response regulator [Alphaproteobacteria bacterium]|nr:response regulator [Alphaproteobacteria bacterium]
MAVNKQMSILVVEDNTTMRRIVANLVRDLGFPSPTEAIDGTDALNKLRGEKKIDFIISDWHMEPMTGLELLKQVRADEKLKALPFLMVTAESKPENIIAAKQAGVSNYIVKPFSADTLKTKMATIFGPF